MVDRAYWNQLQAQQEQRYGLPPGLLDRVMNKESAYRPDVISGQRLSSAGAIGPYQFMPATAQGLGIDPLNPEQATEGAARLLRENLDRRGGDLRLALADYNAGPGVTNAVLAGRRGFKPETVDYMASFEDFYGSNPTPDWATLQGSPPSGTPPAGSSMAPAGIASAPVSPPPSGAGASSDQLEQMMMELLRPSPEPQRSGFDTAMDALGMAGMAGLRATNPEAFQTMAMISQMFGNRERERRKDRRERAMLGLQFMNMRNRQQPKRTATIENLEYLAANPAMMPLFQQMNALQNPMEYAVVGDQSTGIMRIPKRPGAPPETVVQPQAGYVKGRNPELDAARLAFGQEFAELDPQMSTTSSELVTARDIRDRLSTNELRLLDPALLLRAVDPQRGQMTTAFVTQLPDEVREPIGWLGKAMYNEAFATVRQQQPTGPITDPDFQAAINAELSTLAADPEKFIDQYIDTRRRRIDRYSDLRTRYFSDTPSSVSPDAADMTEPADDELRAGLQQSMDKLTEALQGAQ